MNALPIRAKLFVSAITVAGVVAAIYWGRDAAGWDVSDALAWGAILLATAVSERFPLRLRHGGQLDEFTLSDAIWTCSILLAPLLNSGLRRRAPYKLAFNSAQYVVIVTAALGVFEALGSPDPARIEAWAAVALAMGVLHALNAALVGFVIALAERRPIGQFALPSAGATQWLGNVSLGIVGAVLAVAEPAAVPLLLVPLGLTYSAYRGWIHTLQERDDMAEMGRSADAVAGSADLSKRLVEPVADDAVGSLARTLNRMLARLEASVERERVFVRESSHELRTPIAIVQGHIEVLPDEPSLGELTETHELILDEMSRMARIVDDMNDLALMEDPGGLQLAELPVDRFVAAVATKAAPLVDGCLEVAEAPGTGQLRADPQRLTQALINLLKNAGEHARANGAIQLRVRYEPHAWRFEVADGGGGVPAELVEHVFQPFRSRRGSNGSGLGLAIVAGIAEAHGGSAGVDNRPGEGATFWVRIPR